MTEDELHHLLSLVGLAYVGLVALIAPIWAYWWFFREPESGDD